MITTTEPYAGRAGAAAAAPAGERGAPLPGRPRVDHWSDLGLRLLAGHDSDDELGRSGVCALASPRG